MLSNKRIDLVSPTGKTAPLKNKW